MLQGGFECGGFELGGFEKEVRVFLFNRSAHSAGPEHEQVDEGRGMMGPF